MTNSITTSIALLLVICTLFSAGCVNANASSVKHSDQAWPGALVHDDPEAREVTIIIALSSVLPAGIIGHSGIAVDEQYWDFGPQRVKKHQRVQAFDSIAGPWWDDPDQRWQTDRSLEEVLHDVPNKMHPPGSILAVLRVEVTDAQADDIIVFWDETYRRMLEKQDRYQLRGRQCANMVGWSLAEALDASHDEDNRLPRALRMMSPTRLYETLREDLKHTAGEHAGEPADITLWQLGPGGLEPWRRPAIWEAMGVPELPRTRLAIERVKHLPMALLR